MRLRWLISNQTNPYRNVAVENYLLSQDEGDTVTLYLWKNHRTVVIGQNQNPFAECNVDLLQQDGGYVMRRRTGGGAVYHDDGNINFSFIVPVAFYDVQRQFEVIRRAVGSFGVPTELSGRNDILCQGRKFSGNAFSKGRSQNLHHGTILIKSNMEDLQRYLKPRPAKLQKHGVASVRSRVLNLADAYPGITSESIVMPLVRAFEGVYGQQATLLDFEEVSARDEVAALFEQFASDEWLFGKWRCFESQRSFQYPWGGVELSLQIDAERGVVTDVQLATDSLDTSLPDQFCRLMTGASVDVPPMLPPDASPELADLVRLVYD